jgi:U2 small nuclear ribonucleoprotein B''
MQGFPFFDKPMRIAFARDRSDAAVKADGSVAPAQREKRKREGGSAGGGGGGAPPSKRAATDASGAGASTHGAPLSVPSSTYVPPPPAAAVALPSPTLLVTGVPAEVSSDMLSTLFGAFAGLRGVRHLAERRLAFVDYDSEATATPALLALNNFQITATAQLAVAYAPKA